MTKNVKHVEDHLHQLNAVFIETVKVTHWDLNN
jgi:hypothetical protein